MSDITNLLGNVHILPFQYNASAKGYNNEQISLSAAKTFICELTINLTQPYKTYQIGFFANLESPVNSTFILNVDGTDRLQEYKSTSQNIHFSEVMNLDAGLHRIAVYATTESAVNILPREARLEVFL